MTQAWETLKSELDALALESMLGAADAHSRLGEWSEALGRIRAAATEALAGAGAEAALAEIEALTARLAERTAAEDWNGAASDVQTAVERMQKMLEQAPVLEHAPEHAPEPKRATLSEMAQDPELLGDFVVESREHLANIEAQMLRIEQQPADPEALNSSFRSFHTIKGLAGFLELNEVRELAHEVETALDLARSGELVMTPPIVSVVLESADFLNHAVTHLEGVLGGAAFAGFRSPHPIIASLKAVLAGGAGAVPAPASAADVPEEPEAALEEAAGKAAKTRGATSVKVDTQKLDRLVDLVGELVINQSLVRHDPDLAQVSSQRLQRSFSQLSRITEEIQKATMSMRLVSLQALFQKMVRLVRDTAKKTNKQVEVQTFGEETELDRNMVEALADPLMHMIRNAVDHGVEPSAADRERAGKPRKAMITLRAGYQGGQIVIEIADDGRGLNRDKIVAKAIERGLIADGARLSDGEVFNLIFQPGFSTAEKVTDLSGRGVGMDVVRKQIEKLRGRVDIESKMGAGTTFRLRLPLTLAIIDGLVIEVGRERHVVPTYMVREMLRLTPEMVSTVEGKSEMALIRGKLVPIRRLYEWLGVEPRCREAWEGLLVVSESQGRPYGLLVDHVLGKQEIVVKSLGPLMKHLRGVAGGGILGDGRVGLILDLETIFRG